MSVATPLEGISKLHKDVRAASTTLTEREARYLVDAYYTIQGHRIEAQSQARALDEAEEPNEVVGWLFDQHRVLEREIQKVLDAYTDSKTPGRWAKSITGIGPIISAGLLAHIDITRAPTVGHIWRFAGLDPTVKWEKKTKRPWNAQLKVLCWKAGESFVKVSGNDKDIYGHVYAERKLLEIERNEAGLFADQAKLALAEKSYGKTTDAFKWYEKGMLPPARIHARSKRYAVKLFLAHFHHVAYESAFGEPPPKPYVIEHLGHAHYISPPNWPLET